MRSCLLPALVAAAATMVPLLAMPVMTSAAAAPAAAMLKADDAEPLEVVINSLTPSYLPGKGTIRMRGTVTNVSDERWRAINVLAFIDDQPLTSSAALAETSTTPVDAEVGTRITEAGTFDNIGSLAPGDSTTFLVELKRNQVPVSAAGAYWFGAHALGNTTEARDGVADGRARTLLPLVPPETRGAQRAALVLPLRRAIRHAPDGRLRSAERWATDLSEGGRLRTLAEFGAAAGTLPLTWLVDPAVPDAVARLVQGNLPRTLEETVPPDSGNGTSEDADPSDSSSPESEAPSDDESAVSEPSPNVAAEPGAAWLSRLEGALVDDEVLTLPYGDPDVAAVASFAPQFYDTAVRRSGTELGRWQVRGDPAVAPPDGFLPIDALSLLDGEDTVILGDQALTTDEVRAVGRVAGQRVLFASSGTALGGPSPGDPYSELAMRQRFLAEAAVRLLFHDRTPLVSVFPPAFTPDAPFGFWTGLDAPWLELSGTDDLGRGQKIPLEEIRYPVEQELSEVDAENFEAAERLIARGRTLDGVLPRNDVVAGLALDEALTSLSYTERDRTIESRSDSDAAVAWIDQRLSRIRIGAPRGVTLSSERGEFSATVTNRLGQPVSVRVQTESQGDVRVEPSDPIELAAGGRLTVLLNAEATSTGVHYVRVMVTDEEGTPLGGAQRVAIRSAQVSDVIWLVLGLGVGLLFLAIAIRILRRVRRERA